MSQAKHDAVYLFEHYKQTNEKGFVEMLFQRLTKQKTPREAKAIANEFKKLIKGA
jgi:hypothetical protein